MDQATHNKIVSFIWGIADDVLRDLSRRGKYPDVILPICVLLRLVAVLDPIKSAVLAQRARLGKTGIRDYGGPIGRATFQVFHNASLFPFAKYNRSTP